MLAVLASIALFVGGVQTAMIVSDEISVATQENQEALVEVSAIETDEVGTNLDVQ